MVVANSAGAPPRDFEDWGLFVGLYEDMLPKSNLLWVSDLFICECDRIIRITIGIHYGVGNGIVRMVILVVVVMLVVIMKHNYYNNDFF